MRAPCERDREGVIRAFLDQNFSQSLLFNGGKLVLVSLDVTYDTDLLVRAVEIGRKAINEDELAAKFKSYVTGPNDVTYTFLEGVTLDKQATNVQSLMKSAPANMSKADLIASIEGDKTAIVIQFSFPKLDQIKRAEQAKQPIESF